LNGTASGVETGSDSLTGIENVIGGAGNDIITGNAADNAITAGLGNDTVFGSAGGDALDGGAGIDTINYASATNAVSVNLSSSAASGVDIGSDVLIRFENVTAGSGNDTLVGDTSNNALDSGAGTDTLVLSGAVLEYTVSDTGGVVTLVDTTAGRGGTDTAVHFESFQSTDQTITFDGTNFTLVALDDTNTTDNNTTLAIAAADLIANDIDLDSDTLTITSIDSSATLGTVTDEGGVTFTYDPGTAFDSLTEGTSATDSFTYTVSDGTATDTATATVTVTITVIFGVTTSLIVGDTDIETFTASAGDLFTGVIIGNTSTGEGSVTVSSTATLTTTSSGIFVGKAGTGTLTVDSGGTVTLSPPTGTEASLDIGSISGASGTVTVTGLGSTLVVANGDISVGELGTGTLTVSGGGR
jgi:T5SS/PEP-CTERM-associated repeat protein